MPQGRFFLTRYATETVLRLEAGSLGRYVEYFAKDLLPILEDIKNSHKGDIETSDCGYTMEELEQIADAARNGGNKIRAFVLWLLLALLLLLLLF